MTDMAITTKRKDLSICNAMRMQKLLHPISQPHNLSVIDFDKNLVSTPRTSLFVCSANERVRMVWGRIRARWAVKPLYTLSTPSVEMVFHKQSKIPL